MNDIENRVKELEQRIKVLGRQYAQLEQRVEELAFFDVEDDDVEDVEQIATNIYEVAIAKLEPTQDDVVFVWLPVDKWPFLTLKMLKRGNHCIQLERRIAEMVRTDVNLM